ncbi:M15 family metallopeptidase [Hymenobacter volaticus]|uniref:D-alanyl-D-alanine dipeptidase n=1 Tax=Hymenobacter volaticus TaxID=2932254 RepID=A0ABY4G2Q1_9BACT|nr:M15 family metallopeptidase [Hymenobacter volaticus]UOQ65140.1 M15 family metallopeptidase [Hymenobacter volaticus]
MMPATNASAAPNAHNLPVVSDVATYQHQAQANPEAKLVDVKKLIPTIELDIRYATSVNVLGEPLYPNAVAFLRAPAAAALQQVQAALAAQGVGLVVFDAYRPYSVTVRFWNQIQDETYAAPPWRGSRHNRGCSVDVGLVDAAGQPLLMPTDFDDLTPAAHAAYEPVTAEVRRNRTLLLDTMAAFNFVNYPAEWWHFDFARWAEFELLDIPFSALAYPN